MDPSKRRILQEALAEALARNSFIIVGATNGRRILLKPDFTCFEDRVEGTSRDGEIISLPYEEISHAAAS